MTDDPRLHLSASPVDSHRPAKQRRALLESILPRDNWTERRRNKSVSSFREVQPPRSPDWRPLFQSLSMPSKTHRFLWTQSPFSAAHEQGTGVEIGLPRRRSGFSEWRQHAGEDLKCASWGVIVRITYGPPQRAQAGRECNLLLRKVQDLIRGDGLADALTKQQPKVDCGDGAFACP